MTNYNERLDEAIPDESKDTELQRHLRNVWHDNFSEQAFIDEMEAYITSLIKELVKEAKPELPVATSWQQGIEKKSLEDAIRVYEYRLLKALEEV